MQRPEGFIRDLLTNPAFGIGLEHNEVVLDSAPAGGRDIPDLTALITLVCQPDSFAVGALLVLCFPFGNR